MTGRELFQQISKGTMPAYIPFVPIVYEHGARLIGERLCDVATKEDLIVESQLKSYILYGQDLVSVGVDIYNIEFEALGGELKYFSEAEKLPEAAAPIIGSEEDLRFLKVPNPLKDGRMPIFLNACERINKEIGDEVSVSAAIVGPFTLAAICRGFESFIMDLLTDPEFAMLQIDFAMQVGIAYGKAYLDRNIGVAINDSWITPPLLSPSLYREYVFEVHKKMIGILKEYKNLPVSLISGGNTTKISPLLVKTGTALLMADACTDQKKYKELCRDNGILLRASIDSSSLPFATETKLREMVAAVVKQCGDYYGFIMGCGVVGYDTEPEQVLLLKKIVKEYTRVN